MVAPLAGSLASTGGIGMTSGAGAAGAGAAGAGGAGLMGILGPIGGLGMLGLSLAGLFGGDKEQEIPGEFWQLIRNQAKLSDLGLDYARGVYPQLTSMNNQIVPLLQDQLRNPGLP